MTDMTDDTPKKIHPGLKMALEMGPIAAFFVAYLRLKDQVYTIGGTDYDGFVLVTAGFIPLLLICTAILWKLTGHLSKMQIVTAILVTVFGGLTVWLNDDRFFKMKPTMIYTLFAAILGFGIRNIGLFELEIRALSHHEVPKRFRDREMLLRDLKPPQPWHEPKPFPFFK